MYEVYPPQCNDSIICETLTEVLRLVSANVAQTRRIFYNTVATVNGYDIVNYSR